ncbi:MAG: dTDP-glucose 4,6-dehydratase [Candidatus Aminicenantes bacterium]|nr:dTDP-glucose 4,6-dehydratase [Candidatus Aminicenantes bacterium]
MKKNTLLVTGGAGFIGSNFIHHVFNQPGFSGKVVNYDSLTYAGNQDNLLQIQKKWQGQRYFFIKGDVNDRRLLHDTLARFKPHAIVNFAAESHVDRSIDAPLVFIDTNIKGTAALLEEALAYWQSATAAEREKFRFLHISTDEVFGTLAETGLFSETTPYRPNSPYAASKAASDHLLHAWHITFGLPVLLTNCSNNYGPYQFPEKLIPLMIINCLHEKPLPVYGRGANIRDWLYVADHCQALWQVLDAGRIGESYNIGGGNELKNIDVVKNICAIMDDLKPRTGGKPYRELITFVSDRPGHDYRYAIDFSKIKNELGWKPQHGYQSGLAKTVTWYIDHEAWWRAIQEKKYDLGRLGIRK